MPHFDLYLPVELAPKVVLQKDPFLDPPKLLLRLGAASASFDYQ